MRPSEEEAKLQAARQLIHGTATPRLHWKLPAFTVAVLTGYLAYFYLWEEPRSPAEPVPMQLPENAVRRLPDGRCLMADGSIRMADGSIRSL